MGLCLFMNCGNVSNCFRTAAYKPGLAAEKLQAPAESRVAAGLSMKIIVIECRIHPESTTDYAKN